jgi:hypothetical protein
MVSKAGLSNPTRLSSASMRAATSRSFIPAKAFGIIHLAASESLAPASAKTWSSHSSFRIRNRSTRLSVASRVTPGAIFVIRVCRSRKRFTVKCADSNPARPFPILHSASASA